MKLVIRFIPNLFIIVVFTWCFLFFFYQQTQIYFKTNISQGWSKDKTLQKARNTLIDKYEENNDKLAGENGRGILLAGEEKEAGESALKLFRINTKVSDLVALNRKVPDSRPLPCRNLVFDESVLPTTAVVIPFHDEWPSILLRTIYSLINRSPRRLLNEIILVDDASSLESLKEPLDKYIDTHFPRNLIKMIRLNKRSGLINARLRGFDLVTAEVVCFLDSHMEVNINWLEPLLVEIKKNNKTFAMSQLDYIKAETLQYNFHRDYKPRYGFNWRLQFFEDFFRIEQMQGKQLTDSFPGVVMVGSAFAVNGAFFKEIGTYDAGMKIWGGENLELSWRVSMCGGQLVHCLCSHIGHIARAQPYNFPGGRLETEIYNYKRAVDVWMGPYKKYVYNAYPSMKDIDVGNLTDRLELKKRLTCKSFDWYLDNVWPELFRFEHNVRTSGQLRNVGKNVCLDNNNYLFRFPTKLFARPCQKIFADQGFSLTHDYKIRTSLNCVGLQCDQNACFANLMDCMLPDLERWNQTEDGLVQTKPKNLCLEIDEYNNAVVGSRCNASKATQKWTFVPIII